MDFVKESAAKVMKIYFKILVESNTLLQCNTLSDFRCLSAINLRIQFYSFSFKYMQTIKILSFYACSHKVAQGCILN